MDPNTILHTFQPTYYYPNHIQNDPSDSPLQQVKTIPIHTTPSTTHPPIANTLHFDPHHELLWTSTTSVPPPHLHTSPHTISRDISPLSLSLTVRNTLLFVRILLPFIPFSFILVALSLSLPMIFVSLLVVAFHASTLRPPICMMFFACVGAQNRGRRK